MIASQEGHVEVVTKLLGATGILVNQLRRMDILHSWQHRKKIV
jgi:hypothetical protein